MNPKLEKKTWTIGGFSVSYKKKTFCVVNKKKTINGVIDQKSFRSLKYQDGIQVSTTFDRDNAS